MDLDLHLESAAPLMDEDLREDLHHRLAPCLPLDFLRAYTAADPDWPASQILPQWVCELLDPETGTIRPRR